MFQEKGEVQILPDLLHLSLSLHLAGEVTREKILQERCQNELHYARKSSSLANVLLIVVVLLVLAYCKVRISSVSSSDLLFLRGADTSGPFSGSLDEVKQTRKKIGET